MFSRGYSQVRSVSAAMGFTSFSVNSRTIFWTSACSLLRLNSIIRFASYLQFLLSLWMPAMFRASCFLPSMLHCREIMIRCAWGEPAPCMDSVR